MHMKITKLRVGGAFKNIHACFLHPRNFNFLLLLVRGWAQVLNFCFVMFFFFLSSPSDFHAQSMLRTSGSASQIGFCSKKLTHNCVGTKVRQAMGKQTSWKCYWWTRWTAECRGHWGKGRAETRHRARQGAFWPMQYSDTGLMFLSFILFLF